MAGRTKVAFLISQTTNQANGGLASITEIMRRLAKDLEPIILTQADTPMSTSWQRLGFHVVVLPQPNPRAGLLKRLTRFVATNRFVAQVLRQHDITVVHCNDIQAFEDGALGARLAGARVILNIRDIKADHEVYGIKWTAALNLANYVLVLSEEMASAVRRRVSSRGPCSVSVPIEHIYSAVDPATFSPLPPSTRCQLREELGLPAHALVMLYVGAFCPKKDQLRFIQHAAGQLLERLPNAYLYFVGDHDPASDRYALACRQACTNRVPPDRVTFVGYTPRVSDWYRAADLTLLASKREGLARCMIESLACGTPVVSFAVCSAREVLTRHGCGEVIERGDYEHFCDAVASLAAEPDRRLALGENGVRTARRLFDPEITALRHITLYRQLEIP